MTCDSIVQMSFTWASGYDGIMIEKDQRERNATKTLLLALCTSVCRNKTASRLYVNNEVGELIAWSVAQHLRWTGSACTNS